MVTLPSTLEKKAIVPIQRLTLLQMKERRERGLCYDCDKKWGLGHKCMATRLFIMECTDSSEEEEVQLLPNPSNSKDDSVHLEYAMSLESVLGVSIHALSGSPTSKTMQLVGSVNGYSMVILIDIGSTHNFMNPSISRRDHL